MQNLARRLALTASSLRPWPEHPVPIALVITDLDVGGAEQALVTLATSLDRRRWSPLVVNLSPEGKLAAVVRRAGLPCESLGVDRRRPAQALIRLTRTLRRHRPQLVQSFLFHANVAAKLASPLAGRPWVVGGIRVAEREKHWHLTLDRLTQRLSAGAVCVSQGVRRFSLDVGGLDPGRLTVIPNGIDPGAFDRAVAVPRETIGVPETAHLVLCVGRLDVQKGLPDLLAAAEEVIAARPDWHLALAGDGPRRNWLLEHLRQNPVLERHVHWLGHRGDVPGLLRSADLLVLASHWEGMPNAVLEAMAAGRPVVATAVEGTEDLVVHGESGWLVPPRDPAALGQALLEAASRPDLCRRFGAAGRLRVEREFSAKQTLASYESLWAGLLGYRLYTSSGTTK